MSKDTVEGAQLAREIAPFIFKKINKKKLHLMINLLRYIIKKVRKCAVLHEKLDCR